MLLALEASPMHLFPPKSELTICFAHVAYQLGSTFQSFEKGFPHFQTWNAEETQARIGEADILVISGLWRNELLAEATKLRFIQSIGAGYDQFPLELLREKGIRLASARGVNRNAVGEHAFALILALTRKIHIARDNQGKCYWRPMIQEIAQREDELAGKTLGIVGLGHIGSLVAQLGKAFDMRVIATKRRIEEHVGAADLVLPPAQLPVLVRESDFVVLTCPLTSETQGLIDQTVLGKMKRSAYLINVARGACVDEDALLEALRSGGIAGAGLDHLVDDPLPETSPFWELENVIVTPHTAGETQLYERNVIEILLDNIDRLGRGEAKLKNEIV